jgi:hypothetical protein
MAKKEKTFQLNFRCSTDDLENLRQCQKLLGNLSQSDTLRLIMLLFLKKVPTFSAHRKPGVEKCKSQPKK